MGIQTYGGTGTSSTKDYYFWLGWSMESQSAVTNSSMLKWEFELNVLSVKSDYVLTIEKNIPVVLNINGTEITFNIPSGEYENFSETQINWDRIYIPHNADGSKTFSVSFTIGGTNANIPADSASNHFTLPTIARKATIRSAPNFTDLENPTITYRNPAGTGATSLQACISFTGAADNVAYRDIPKDGTSYSFPLTAAEKATLRKGVTSGNQTTVRFYVKSTVNGITYWDYLTKTFTIANPEPTITPTVKDTNARAVALTGNNHTFIKYVSMANYNIGAKAVDGATITSQYIINGAQRVDNVASGNLLNAVESNTFYFSATDSRGYTSYDAIVVDLIPYIKLTGSLTIDSFYPNGEMTFTIRGKYFNGSFGAVSNTLDVDYQLKPDGEDISEVYRLVNVMPTVDSLGNYEYSYTITGLDHTKTYELSVYAIDEVGNSFSVSSVAAPIPVFDWGKDDFRHNTDVSITEGHTLSIGGRLYGEQQILWQGASHMNGSQSIALSAPISSQPNGVVLVFSLYQDGAAEDVSISSFFVSKQEVVELPDAPHSFFLLINAGFSTIGAKYIYISDTKLRGHEGNTSSGSNNGITFNNSMFVLRYVIGV